MTRRLLVVEDSRPHAEALAAYLRLEGWEVAAAADGNAALAALMAGPPPDAVLCDLRMPGMGGRHLLERLRADPAWAAIPVVVTTAVADPDGLPLPENAAVLIKPFQAEDLIGVLHALESGKK